MSGRWGWPHVIGVSVSLMGLLLLADVEGPVRVIAALWFFLVCPGMAFAPLLPLPSKEAAFAAGVVLSLVINTLVATAIAEIGGLTETSAFVVLAALSILGAGLQLARSARDYAL
jgi:hypothetical protein